MWDFGDQCSDPVDGYGSMQVHNPEAKQTLFAFNNWKAGASADIGIGNSDLDARTRDWTFAANAGSYSRKTLRVAGAPEVATPIPFGVGDAFLRQDTAWEGCRRRDRGCREPCTTVGAKHWRVGPIAAQRLARQCFAPTHPDT